MKKVSIFIALLLLMVALSVIFHGGRWEVLDSETLIALSEEQDREVTYGAAKWSRGKIEKLVLRGPKFRETRYPDGRIEYR